MALAYHWQNDACMFVAITGVIWGLWHAPAIVMGHNYGMGYADVSHCGHPHNNVGVYCDDLLVCLLR